MGSSSFPSSASSSGWGSSDAPSRAPSRSSDQASRPRQGGGGGERAVPRGSAGNGGGATTRGGGGNTASTASNSGSSDQSPSRRAVPTYSRPRDGRPVTGVAVDRVGVPGGGGSNVIVYYPYYPYGYWGLGYGYGLGYLYYDPFYYGSWGYGYGYPGYYGGYGGGGYTVSQGYRDVGSLRLKIDPRQAQVYVDGLYVGVVDSFDGVFQRLGLESGGHKVELKAEGYETLQFDVLITPGETVTYKGEMKKIK
jgi:hypothetical protein